MEERDKVLEYLYTILKDVIPDNVHYIVNVTDKVAYPAIIYYELSSKSAVYADDEPIYKRRVIQITLITKTKQIRLERKLEKKLDQNDIDYYMIHEYLVKGEGLHRVYEIKMEEFKYEQ